MFLKKNSYHHLKPAPVGFSPAIGANPLSSSSLVSLKFSLLQIFRYFKGRNGAPGTEDNAAGRFIGPEKP